MLFWNIPAGTLDIFVLFVVILANGLGIIARIKPIQNPFFHTFHHIFYFLVIFTTSIALVHSYFIKETFYFHIFIIGLMVVLPFFKKGRRGHIFIGVVTFVFAIILVVSKYFN